MIHSKHSSQTIVNTCHTVDPKAAFQRELIGFKLALSAPNTADYQY